MVKIPASSRRYHMCLFWCDLHYCAQVPKSGFLNHFISCLFLHEKVTHLCLYRLDFPPPRCKYLGCPCSFTIHIHNLYSCVGVEGQPKFIPKCLNCVETSWHYSVICICLFSGRVCWNIPCHTLHGTNFFVMLAARSFLFSLKRSTLCRRCHDFALDPCWVQTGQFRIA